MAFSRNWTGKIDFTAEFLADVRKIISTSQVTIKNGVGKDKPIITTKEIKLNGDASVDENYETFHLQPHDLFGFTKTKLKPYDEVVAAILFRAAYHNPFFDFTSNYKELDENALQLYVHAFGTNPPARTMAY